MLTKEKLAIGDSYGGGIVFYVSEDGHHGLIAAKSDQSTGIRWHAGENIETGATADGVGAGKENTAKIIATQGDGSDYAAKLCAEYSVTVEGVTYDDWYLPSIQELNLLYQQRNVIGDFGSEAYWSSTEYHSNFAWYLFFGNSYQYYFYKYSTCRVRAVRAF